MTWQALYQSALHSEPSQLLETIQFAKQSMQARASALAFAQLAAEQTERRALFLALSDLYVLSAAFRARKM
jgi:hypothetical protein